MSNFKRPRTEQPEEQFLGNLLRTGVLLSAAVVLLGGILYLFRHGLETPNYRVFQGEPAEFRLLPDIWANAITLNRRRSVIQLGLLILVATPVLRVAYSVYAFAKQGDRLYFTITLTVFVILLYSLFKSS